MLAHWKAVMLVASVLVFGCTSRGNTLTNVASSEADAAEQLRRLGAFTSTDDDGHLIQVKFFANPDANNPTVGDRDVQCLAELPKLRRLEMNPTAVTDAGFEVVRNLPELEFVDVPHGVTDKGIASLAGLGSLRGIIMSTHITDDGLVALGGLTQLRSLDLNHCRISGAGLANLASLKQLTHLSLNSTQVSAEGLEVLNDLPELEYLDLNHTEVDDDTLIKISPTVERLKELQLNSTQISDASLPVLRGAKRLKRLGLHRTDLTEAGVASLRQALSQGERVKIDF